jgi:hypothetical protein
MENSWLSHKRTEGSSRFRTEGDRHAEVTRNCTKSLFYLILTRRGSVLASIFARFCPLPFLTGSHPASWMPRLARPERGGFCTSCDPLTGGARTNLYRADEWSTAGPCFNELGLDVVNVVFEVKLGALAVKRFRLGLSLGDGRVLVAIQRD